MIWNMFIFTLILFIAVILISRMKVNISFKIKNLSECMLDIYISFAYGLVRIKRSLDMKELMNNLFHEEEKSIDSMNKWKRELEHKASDDVIKKLKAPILEALQKVVIHHFIWKTGAGSGDAASTGKLAGAIWSIKGMMEAWLKRYIQMEQAPELSFLPFFQTVGFESQISCMVSMRTGNAILTTLGLYKKWKRLNNRRVEMNGTSNQGVNDDSDGKFEGNDRREYDRWRSG